MEGTAAQYTTEKAVEGTKAAARAVQGVAGYAGHKAAEIVAKPLGAAKEVAVSTGETMKEYTARKKEEAERELMAKRSSGRQQVYSSSNINYMLLHFVIYSYADIVDDPITV